MTQLHHAMPTSRIFAAAFTLALALAGCADEENDEGGENEEMEIITTVTLTFTPSGGGGTITASFRDPDGDGGMSGMTDALALTAETTYAMSVAFVNELANPAEDITVEVREEAEDHQVFVYGSGVSGPAMPDTASAVVDHTYADQESDYTANAGDDLPVGLSSTITTRTAGTGDLRIVLRHLPELNGAPQKVAGLVDDLSRGDPLPGEVDVDVTFALAVQ